MKGPISENLDGRKVHREIVKKTVFYAQKYFARVTYSYLDNTAEVSEESDNNNTLSCVSVPE